MNENKPIFKIGSPFKNDKGIEHKLKIINKYKNIQKIERH